MTSDKMSDQPAELTKTFERLRQSWLEQRPPYEQRIDDLKRLRIVLHSKLDDMTNVISRDFGNRSVHETLLGEASIVFAEIDHALRHLKRWMKPENRRAGWKLWPAKAQIHYVPIGVVGIIAPWNYPVNLALVPLISAIAAGNHVFLKPSEHTPLTSEFLRNLLEEVFPDDRVAIALGDTNLSAKFATLPFDHLFFTGSSAVGRKVMAAAAQNLTPVTLELGGKSPTIVTEHADLPRAAAAIATGKFFNAGQTCIAPDYLLIHHSKRDEFITLLSQVVDSRYRGEQALCDRTTIINDMQFSRLTNLLKNAREHSETIIPLLAQDDIPHHDRLLAPSLVVEPSSASAIMNEEIFGPLLPIISYRSLDDAVVYIQKHDRPLALYCFSKNAAEIHTVLTNIVAGGVCINDTLYHFACTDLPFGGIGNSGMGQYHGRDGFLTFSKAMPVLTKYSPSASNWIKPPYRGLSNWLIRLITR